MSKHVSMLASVPALVSSGRRVRLARALLAALPLLAIALLAILVSSVVWYVDREEAERQRLALLTDALWVEQTLRFQLGVEEDSLSRLALESGRREVSDESLLGKARQVVSINPEIAAIVWLRADGTSGLAIPPVADLPTDESRKILLRLAKSATMRPVYGPPRSLPNGDRVIDMASPIAGESGRGVVVLATVALDALLARHVPWWIAEKHGVRLVDSEGSILARKSSSVAIEERDAHGISFDPPLPGTELQIVPHVHVGANTNTMLISAILALSLLAMGALVLAHRHVRKRLDAETALRAESAFRQAMEDSLTIGMRARDLDRRIIYVNSAFCRMVGMEAKDLIGRAPPMPYWDPTDLERTHSIHDRVVAGDSPPQGIEVRFRRPDGELFDVLIHEAPLIDASGNHAGWMASVLDITDRKRAEEMAKAQDASLQRTARLVTMGEMASTLAHELNQPLSAIASSAAGCLNILATEQRNPDALRVALEKLGAQAQRAGQIIRRVHDFVRKREPKIVPSALEPVLATCLAFADVDLRKHGVRIELDSSIALPPMHADPILIQQVLLNLIRNAAEAMAGSPVERRLLRVIARQHDDCVAISVEDRGPGIPETVRERMFEPFISTKADGMGMGLNICRSIVELHKGRLVMQPRDGGGTVFTVILPIAEASKNDNLAEAS